MGRDLALLRHRLTIEIPLVAVGWISKRGPMPPLLVLSLIEVVGRSRVPRCFVPFGCPYMIIELSIAKLAEDLLDFLGNLIFIH